MSLSGSLYVLQYLNGSLQLTKANLQIYESGNVICSNLIETFNVPLDASVDINIFGFETNLEARHNWAVAVPGENISALWQYLFLQLK